MQNLSLATSPSPPGRLRAHAAKRHAEGKEGLANIILDHVSLECIQTGEVAARVEDEFCVLRGIQLSLSVGYLLDALQWADRVRAAQFTCCTHALNSFSTGRGLQCMGLYVRQSTCDLLKI